MCQTACPICGLRGEWITFTTGVGPKGLPALTANTIRELKKESRTAPVICAACWAILHPRKEEHHA